MKGNKLKIFTGMLVSIILIVGVTPISAKAKDTTHKVVSIANKKYTNTQAFSVGSRYAYYIQRYKGEGNAYKLYRSDIKGKKKAPVEIKAIKPSDASAFGHANDMVTFSQKGNTHLLVTTYEKGNSKANQDLTNIEIYKNKAGKLTYKAVGHYKLRLRGKIVGVGGVDKLSSKGTMYTFIVKIAKKIYTVSIDVSKSKKTADLKYVGTLNFGKKYNNYIRQGIEFDNGKLYVPLWAGQSNENKSVILKYDWKGVLKKKTASYEKCYAARRKDVKKFEIEGCNVLRKRLYYATNSIRFHGGQFDEIGYFKL